MAPVNQRQKVSYCRYTKDTMVYSNIVPDGTVWRPSAAPLQRSGRPPPQPPAPATDHITTVNMPKSGFNRSLNHCRRTHLSAYTQYSVPPTTTQNYLNS
eukprot:6637761-Pyramimonas_sp.AAC.1